MRPDTLIATGFVLAWSSGFVGAELGTRTASAGTLLAWRFLLVGVLVGGWWLATRRRRLTLRAVGLHAVIGALSQGVFLFAVVWSIDLGVSPGTSALVASLQPLVASLAGRGVLGESASAAQWFGLLGGLAGVALVVSGDLAGHAPWPAYLLPFVAMLALVVATLLERASTVDIPAADAFFVQCMSSLVLFGVLALALGGAAPPQHGSFWLAVVWTAVLSHIGGYGFYWLTVRRSSVARASSLLYLTPPATAVLALVLFGQPIDGRAVAGMAVCLASVMLVRGFPARRRSGRTARAAPGSVPRGVRPAAARRRSPAQTAAPHAPGHPG